MLLPLFAKTLFHAIDKMDVEEFVLHLDPDCEFRFGNSAPAKGHKEIREAVGGFFSSIKGLSHTIHKVIENGPHAVCEGTVTYTRKDNSKVAINFANVFEMKDGKVKKYNIYIDMAPLFSPS